MKIMFSLDFSSPGTVFLIYGSETHVKMVQRRMPKWLRDAFQNGSETYSKNGPETHSKMAWVVEARSGQ